MHSSILRQIWLNWWHSTVKLEYSEHEYSKFMVLAKWTQIPCQILHIFYIKIYVYNEHECGEFMAIANSISVPLKIARKSQRV
jgi:hypothetical protein